MIWYPEGLLQVHRVIYGNMGNVMVSRGTLSVDIMYAYDDATVW